MTTRSTNEACLSAHLAAEGRHDMAATLQTVHPDCEFVDEPLGLRFVGRDGARRHYEMWWTGFGVTLDSGALHWVNDDLVIGDATFIGRHDGRFAGISPTGRPLRLPFACSSVSGRDFSGARGSFTTSMGFSANLDNLRSLPRPGDRERKTYRPL